MHAKDHKILQYVTKLSSRVIEVDQVSAAQLYHELIIKKMNEILVDSTHPLL